MKHLTLAIVSTGFLLAGIGAHGQTTPPVLSAKKQLIVCMNGQMSASKTLSYNDATKACKRQLKSLREAMIAGNQGKNSLGR